MKNEKPLQSAPATELTNLHTLRAAAEASLARGYYIFPLKSRSKEPLALFAPHGFKSSSNDSQQALKAWDAGVRANHAIDCGRSDLTVVDVDYGFQSLEDFEAWRKEHALPTTYSVRTGRRDAYGVQMYFRGAIPSGNFKLGNATGQIKSIGGYVVGEGSIHPDSGEMYVPIVDAPIADTPAQIKTNVTAKPKTPAKSSSGVVVTTPSDEIIPAGQRWNKLQQVAGRLRNAGLSAEGIEAGLWDFLRTRCEDGENYPVEKVQKLAEWAASEKCDAQPLAGSTTMTAEPTDEECRKLFKNGSEMSDAPLKCLIENFLEEDSVTFIGGLPGNGKTLIGLSISRALVHKTPLFGYTRFVTNERVNVLYLIPECGEKRFKKRMSAFGVSFKDDRFLARTMSDGDTIKLDDARLMKMAKDRVVVLDTAIRFTESKDENSSSENQVLAKACFNLLKAGARAIICVHHSIKGSGKAEDLTLENTLRGNGDLGAMADIVWATRIVNLKSTRLYIKNVKGRDLEPPDPFMIEGRPWIDETHDFKLVSAPGLVIPLKELLSQDKAKKKEQDTEVKYQNACALFEQKLTNESIARTMHIKKQTVSDFFKRWKTEKAEMEGLSGKETIQ